MNNLRVSLAIAVAAAVACISFATAEAQPEPGESKPDAVAEFEKLVKTGEALFGQKSWAEARANFEKAYGLHPRPLLLFNIASTYRREGNKEEALRYYKKYLEVAPPDADYRGVAKEAVINIEEQIAIEKAADPGPSAGGSSSGSTSGGKILRYGGIGLGVIGVASLSFGIVQGLEARDLNDFFENLPANTEWTQEMQDDFERGESLESQAIIFSIAGGVLITAGGVMVLASLIDSSATSEERQLSVTPFTTGNSSGFAVSGSF